MNEKTIIEANQLIKERTALQEALKKPMVKSVDTTVTWQMGCAIEPSRKAMCDAQAEAKEIAELLLVSRASMLIKEINAKLKALGVEVEKC